MSFRLQRGLLLAVVVWAAAPAAAGFAAAPEDFVRQSVPQKWIEPFLPEDLPPLTFPDYYDDVDKARAMVSAGRYKLGLMTLSQAKDVEALRLPEVAVIRSKALAELGRWDKALEALSDPAVADRPRVQVRRAQVLADMGREAEAVELLKKHLEADPRSVPGHYWLGAVSEKVGDLETARREFGWFVEEPQNFLSRLQSGDKAREFETAESVTLIGRAVDRWASLTAAYRDSKALHQSIMDVFVTAYDKVERNYWPARVAAAEYFMSHDMMKNATDELKPVIEANPNATDAYFLLGLLALEQFNFDGAEAAVAAIRKVDAKSIKADVLESRNLLLQRRPLDAEAPAKRVLEQQPKHLEAMGLLAAAKALQLKEDEAGEVLKQVEAIDPDNATAYFEVAQQLGAMRQYPRAAEKYKVAIARAPWWTAPLNGLGLLYTQSGDEGLGEAGDPPAAEGDKLTSARAVLEEARKLDPFNLATTNYMRLLDDMATFARKETDHFILIYDKEKDPLVAEYFLEYLESVHGEIVNNFRHDPSFGGKPEKKTMIEVFPGHDQFSVRTTGSPWIGTVGASTGRVIALVTPGDKQMGTYNWAQVLRHEYTHTVTLSATDNRIAHWMTEGLAVVEERSPMRWEWVPMLYNAVKTKEIFPMEELTWAFVRPKKPHHRSLAYAQSAWVCQYIEEKWGRDALLKMLEDFRKGERQEDVFPKVTGKSIPDFEKEFFAWCEQQVAKWGYDEVTAKKYDELRARGQALVDQRNYAEAVPVWEEIAKLRPVDALPHQRLAGLYLTKDVNQVDKAIEHLDVLQKVELKNNGYAKRIARLHRDRNQLDKASESALLAVYVNPYDLSAHELLLEVYEKAGNEAGAEREKRVIPVLKQWVEARRREGLLRPEEGPKPSGPPPGQPE